jgi:hypothetical protein
MREESEEGLIFASLGLAHCILGATYCANFIVQAS